MKMTRLNSGALQYAIFISLLIAILVFAFISLSYVNNKLKIRAGFYKNAIQNVDDAYQFLSKNEIPFDDNPNIIKSGTNKADSTYISKRNWGIFDVFNVKSKVKNESFQRAALSGGRQGERLALHLQDLKRPLVLVGDTHIEGNVRIPEKGVKRGSIGGKSYYGTQLIYGSMDKSLNALPRLKHREVIENYSRGEWNYEEMEIFHGMKAQEIVGSYFERTILISSWKPLYLVDMNISGNVLIRSDSLIQVSNSAQLEDVILSAPRIVIDEGVTGSFQAFASRSIEMGSMCELRYPSGLVLVDNFAKEMEDDKSILINIKSNSRVKGVVAYLTSKTERSNHTRILINSESTIEGEVYSEGNIELRGTIKGMVTANGFVSNYKGQSFQNHILNGTINESLLPEQYCGLSFENRRISGIAKWLN